MNVSIIIVNYFSESMIKNCIQSVIDKTSGLDYEIIIVDNGSKTEGKMLLNGLSRQNIQIIDAGSNLGFGKANNLGANYATGKYLFLLNPDTILMNNAIKILFDYMESNEDVGVCGGNLFTPDEKPTPSFCLEFGTIDDEKKNAKWFSIFRKKVIDVINRGKQSELKEFNYSDSPKEVGYIFGADMLIRKDLFNVLGGFDRDFFMYAEEEELQSRISKTGLKIVSIPDAKIIHLEGATSSNGSGWSSNQFRMRMRGRMTYFDKCFPPNGADEFYKYRRLRMVRQLKWQKLKGNKPSEAAIDILDNVYTEYCSERRI